MKGWQGKESLGGEGGVGRGKENRREREGQGSVPASKDYTAAGIMCIGVHFLCCTMDWKRESMR